MRGDETEKAIASKAKTTDKTCKTYWENPLTIRKNTAYRQDARTQGYL